MDYLSIIRRPIEDELSDFIELFNRSLYHDNGLLQQALDHIRQRAEAHASYTYPSDGP